MILRDPIRVLSFTVLMLCTFGLSAYAAGDTFEINQLIGSDTTPPTAPSGLTATPVATSQIDLAWTASTDNVAVTGYQVFRDGGQIATTGVTTSYSDTGLTPSTTYSYYVTAFDAEGNVSASSSPAATTTLASTTPPATTTTPSSGGGGDRIEMVPPPLEITRLSIIEGETTVLLEWETAGYVRSILRWGRTSSYELGSIAERAFSRTHETTITGLDPGTRYRYTIEGVNGVGIEGILTEGSFQTLSGEDVFPPANVTELTVARDGADILLSWENPNDPDFSHVRVLRNDRFYPSDTVDGRLVFEGDGAYVRDDGAAVPGTTQFYTVFAYDEVGNVSSGAIVALRIPPVSRNDTDAEVVPPPPPGEDTGPDTLQLALSDFVFEQEGVRIPVHGTTIPIDGTKQLTIKVPYNELPEHLKTILVTLEHPREKGSTFSFLLRVDPAKSWYTATVAPLGESGEYPFVIQVFDFDTTAIGSVAGTFDSTIVSFASPEDTRSGIGAVIRSVLTSTTFYILLVLGVLLIVGYRLLGGCEDKHT